MLTYSTVFTIEDSDGSPVEVISEIRQRIHDWLSHGLEKHHGVRFQTNLDADSAMQPTESITVKNVITDLASNGGHQIIEMTVPDNEEEGVIWKNTITVSWDSWIEYHHEVEVHGAADRRRITIRPPAIVRDLLIHLPCRHNGIPLNLMRRLNRGDVGDFVASLLSDSRRTWPVVLFTAPDPDESLYTNELAWESAKRMAGSAFVALAVDSKTTRALRAAVGGERTTHSGAIGIYEPGFHRECSPERLSRIMPWTVRELQENGSGMTQHLIDKMAWRMAAHRSERPLFDRLVSETEEIEAKRPEVKTIPRTHPLKQLWIAFSMAVRPGSRAKIARLEQELIDSRAHAVDLERELRGARAESTRLSREVENAASRAERERLALEDRIQRQDERLSAEKAEFDAEIAGLEEQGGHLEELVGRIRSEQSESIGRLTEERDSFASAFAESEDRISMYEQLQSEMMAESQFRKGELRSLTKEVEGLRSQLEKEKARGGRSSRKELKLLRRRTENAELEKKKAIRSRDKWRKRHDKIKADQRGAMAPMRDRIQVLEKENSSLRQERHQELMRSQEKTPKDPRFHTVLTALEAAVEENPILYVFDDARKSARDSPYEDRERVYAVLSEMAETAVEYLARKKKGESFSNALRGGGLNIGRETDATVNEFPRKFGTKNEQGIRKKIEMRDHVKLGRGFNDHHHCLRIHYLLDENISRLGIGHCGKHLPNKFGERTS